MLVFISTVSTVRALSTRTTNNTDIESLRFDTRSPSGWLMLVNIIVLPLDISILIIRFLNFSVVIDHIKIFLGIVSKATVMYVVTSEIERLFQHFRVNLSCTC